MPKPSPQDIVAVRNIAVGFEDEIKDVYKKYDPIITPDGRRSTKEVDVTKEYTVKDYFQVRWDGNPYRIRPGKVRLLPRYIADHFAKHLIDFILNRTNVKKLRDEVERNKLRDQIIVKTKEWYLPQEEEESGDGETGFGEEYEDSDEIEEAEDLPEIDLGEQSDESEVEVENDPIKKITSAKKINDLRKECKELGIEWAMTDNKEALARKILAF